MTSDTPTVTAEQFGDAMFVTHVLLSALVLLVGVYVIGELGNWSRRG